MADSKNIWAATLAPDKGSFYRGPLGTPLPTDALDALDPALEDHGFMGDDGFTNGISRDTTKHKAFGGETVYVTQDSYEETVQVTCYESNPIVLRSVFGDDNVEEDYSSGHLKLTVRHTDQKLPRSSFVARFVRGEATRLLVIPEGEVTEIDDIVYVHDDLVKYTLTIDVFTPATGSNPDNPAGVNEYLDDPGVEEGS